MPRVHGVGSHVLGARPLHTQTWMQRFVAERPALPRFSAAWWIDWAIKFTGISKTCLQLGMDLSVMSAAVVVFGITGTSSMLLVRPMIQPIVGEGSFRDGPWRYRILSVLMVTPMYVVSIEL